MDLSVLALSFAQVIIALVTFIYLLFCAVGAARQRSRLAFGFIGGILALIVVYNLTNVFPRGSASPGSSFYIHRGIGISLLIGIAVTAVSMRNYLKNR